MGSLMDVVFFSLFGGLAFVEKKKGNRKWKFIMEF
jgi:hypothetical protein